MKSYKKMTQKEFSTIKAILNAGVPNSMAEKISNRSYFTVAYIGKSASFPDYVKAVREYAARGEEKRRANGNLMKEPVKVNIEETVHTTTSNGILEELQKINANLDRLVEAWNAKPKGLFR